MHGVPPRARRNDVNLRGAGQFSGTPWHRLAASRGVRSPVRSRALGPDALATHLPSSYALLLKGERCGVAAPRITAPHYSSTHSQSRKPRTYERAARAPEADRVAVS